MTCRTKPIPVYAASVGMLCMALVLLTVGVSRNDGGAGHTSTEMKTPPERLSNHNVGANGGFENDFDGWTPVQDVSTGSG